MSKYKNKNVNCLNLFYPFRSHISESLCNSTLDRTLDLDDDATTCGTAQPSTVTTPIPDSGNAFQGSRKFLLM